MYVNVLPFCFNTDTGIYFTAAGSEVEVNDRKIQTEIIETEHKHVQAGSTAKQQGLHNYVLNIRENRCS